MLNVWIIYLHERWKMATWTKGKVWVNIPIPWSIWELIPGNFHSKPCWVEGYQAQTAAKGIHHMWKNIDFWERASKVPYMKPKRVLARVDVSSLTPRGWVDVDSIVFFSRPPFIRLFICQHQLRAHSFFHCWEDTPTPACPFLPCCRWRHDAKKMDVHSGSLDKTCWNYCRFWKWEVSTLVYRHILGISQPH